jgi:hypothetical protein
VPNTLEAVIAHATAEYNSKVSVNPELKKTFESSTKSFIAYSTSSDAIPDANSWYDEDVQANDFLFCQLCDKKGHSCKQCFELCNEKEMAKLVAAVKESEAYKERVGFASKYGSYNRDRDRSRDRKFRRSKEKYPEKPPKSDSERDTKDSKDKESRESKDLKKDTKHVNSIQISEPEHDISSLAIESIMATAKTRVVHFEHDDHASISVLQDQASMDIFESTTTCSHVVKGVVPGSSAHPTAMGSLRFDLGQAVVIENASKNLLSGPELAKKYKPIGKTDHELVYEHRVSKEQLIFRKDPVRFQDSFYHLIIDLEDNVAVSSLDFYNPKPLVPVPESVADIVWPQIRAVVRFHEALNHASVDTMKRLCQSPHYEGDITADAINLFAKHLGCSACARANMKAHTQYPSTRELSKIPGAVLQGDFFYIETAGPSIPVLLLVCEFTLFLYLHAFVDAAERAKSKKAKIMVTTPEVRDAFAGAVATFAGFNRPIRTIRFDREKAVLAESVKELLRSHGIELEPTAAGQHLGTAEVMVRVIKDKDRATAAGIEDRQSYPYPHRFYWPMTADAAKLLNGTPRRGETLSPMQKMRGVEYVLDFQRDLRARIGEVVLVKSPSKGVASHASVPRAEWAIVVSRAMNGTGVLGVYLIGRGVFAHRLKFERRPIPPYIMEQVRNIDKIADPIPNEPVPVDPMAPEIVEPYRYRIGTASVPAEPVETNTSAAPMEPVSPSTPVEPIAEQEAVAEVCSLQVRYRAAVKESPERAKAAMKEELQGLFTKMLWHGIKMRDIPYDERKFILRSMDGYKEKTRPSGEWEKSKARVFTDGSKQLPEFTAESSSPVARIESIFALAGFAAYNDLIVFKIDVICAFPHVPRPPEVRYKYLRLSKDIASIVVEMHPEYQEYLAGDGTMLMELDKMLYGMKEAGYQFYCYIMDMLHKGGYTNNPADACVVHCFHQDGDCHGALTVDDGIYVATSEAMYRRTLRMYDEKFGPQGVGYTVVRGDSLELLGLQFDFDRKSRGVFVSQRGFVQDLMEDVEIATCARSPCSTILFAPSEDSPLLTDDDKELYRSWNQSLMYAATRTYPECLPAATVLASRYVRATQDDMKRLKRAISYLGHDPDHCLVIRPGSMSLIASADTAYGVHVDGKSHDGDCVGFKGCKELPDSYFMFSSGKQTIVTTSSCEAELVGANKGARNLVWGRQLLEGFGVVALGKFTLCRNPDITEYAYEIVEIPSLKQDNTSTIHLIQQGRGNFKNTKHIRVRYYYIRDLVVSGEIEVVWTPTADMVADILSKGVAWAVFKYLLPMLIGKR